LTGRDFRCFMGACSPPSSFPPTASVLDFQRCSGTWPARRQPITCHAPGAWRSSPSTAWNREARRSSPASPPCAWRRGRGACASGRDDTTARLPVRGALARGLLRLTSLASERPIDRALGGVLFALSPPLLAVLLPGRRGVGDRPAAAAPGSPASGHPRTRSGRGSSGGRSGTARAGEPVRAAPMAPARTRLAARARSPPINRRRRRRWGLVSRSRGE
jgi:hypothetical protein